MGNWCFFTPINGVLWGPPGRKLGCPSASSSTNGTSGSYSYLRWEIHFRRAMFTGNPAMWAYVYVYIYIYLPGNPCCHFVLVKTHLSQHVEKISVHYGWAPLRSSNTRPHTHWSFFGTLRGLPRIDKKLATRFLRYVYHICWLNRIQSD